MSLPPLGPELLIHSAFDDTAVRRAHSRGSLVRLAPGRYVRSDVWAPLDSAARHVLRAIAVVTTGSPGLVAARETAACVWELPRLGSPPQRVHLIDPAARAAQGTRTAIKHRGPLLRDDIVEQHGILVTSPIRTAIDLACTASFRQAVVALDCGYRQGLFTAAELLDGVRGRDVHRGTVRAEAAIGFADARADRPGESLSRLVIHEAHLQAPVLQEPFPTRRGNFFVDFWWEEAGVVGEFDGDVKYREPALRGGLSVEDVVIGEKRREDAIREDPRVRRVVRWTWSDLQVLGLVPRLLREAGVRVA